MSINLKKNSWKIWEPNPLLCEEIAVQDLSVILVPGLAFDSDFHRLGYGKGLYDRLLSQCPWHSTFGVGFREQKISEKLPVSAHDISLKDFYLF